MNKESKTLYRSIAFTRIWAKIPNQILENQTKHRTSKIIYHESGILGCNLGKL